MPGRGTNPVDEKYVTAAIAKDMRTETDDESEEPLRLPAEVRSEDPLGHAMPASRDQAERPVQAARRPRRRALRRAERPMASRQREQGSDGPAAGDPSPAAGGSEAGAGEQVGERVREPALGWEDGLDVATHTPARALTAAEWAELDAQHRQRRAYWDEVYTALRLDAQACARSMQSSPVLGDPTEGKASRRSSSRPWTTTAPAGL